MNQSPLVSIIIVNYNGSNSTKELQKLNLIKTN